MLFKGSDAWTWLTSKKGGVCVQIAGTTGEKPQQFLKRFGISIPQHQTVQKYFLKYTFYNVHQKRKKERYSGTNLVKYLYDLYGEIVKLYGKVLKETYLIGETTSWGYPIFKMYILLINP